MSPTHRFIDAQGLPCPQPVILVRKALMEGGFETLEVLVDDAASRENLLKFAAYSRCPVESAETEGTRTRLLLRPATASGQTPAPRTETVPSIAPLPMPTVFIPTDGIGKGDPELAELLLRGFIYTLTECDAPPLRVILMNAGVKLAVEGSDSLENLRKLANRGVEILACGTCLEFYKLSDALGVGRITNMYEIAELLLQGPSLTL